MEPVSFAELIRSSQKVDEPVSWSTSQIVKKGTATDCGAVFSEKWAGAASNRRHQDFQAVATPQTPLERKRNRPSHGQLRTWAVWCGLMRLQAQVAEEGLEPLDASPLHHNELLQPADQRGAESGAVRQRIRLEPDLIGVFEAWAVLAPDTRTAILAIVEAAQGR